MGTFKHRMSQSPTYRSWINMRRRCLDKNHHQYSEYGGRGITICQRWDDFTLFLSDMGERTSGNTIDRIDVNGPYSPGNCRWANAMVQMNNRRITSRITFQGETLSIREWSTKTGIPRNTLAARLYCGWTAEKILSTPYKVRRPRRKGPAPAPKGRFKVFMTAGGRTQPLKSWADELGVSDRSIRGRIRRGWNQEQALMTPFLKSGYKQTIRRI
jgi:hypothetical protein